LTLTVDTAPRFPASAGNCAWPPPHHRCTPPPPSG